MDSYLPYIGSVEPIKLKEVNASINITTALQKAWDVIDAKGITRAKLSSLLNYEERKETGIYSLGNGDYRVAYRFELRPNNMQDILVVVDANNGAILEFADLTCEIDGPKTKTAADLNNVSRTVGVYKLSGVDYMIDASKTSFNASSSSLPNSPVGAMWTINANNTYLDNLTHCSSSDGSINRKDAISAQYNASQCFDYFKNTHGRNGIDGNGGTVM